jgi:hypothetical protein
VLFFFELRGAEEPRMRKIVQSLNCVCRRKVTVVIGLARDDRDRVEKFIKSQQVRFTIGAETNSTRDFRIDRLPAVLVIDGPDREIDMLLTWSPDSGRPTEDWQLMALVESDANSTMRDLALGQQPVACSPKSDPGVMRVHGPAAA